MSPDLAPCPSPSQVDKAGSRLRKFYRGEPVAAEQLDRSVEVLLAWRAAHGPALATANMGLRSMVNAEHFPVEVSQRLKRVPTIVDKLQREPTLALSRMQDIGGVRAVLPSIDAIHRVEARVKARRSLVGYNDYITSPRSSGYRGVHLIVEYRERNVEIQLRTAVMHEWAIAVERISARVGRNLKQDGEHAIQQLMSAISAAMAIEENEGVVTIELQNTIAELRSRAEPYLSASRRG